MQLAARPETSPAYNIRLLPLSTERSALLAQFAIEEKNALESTQAAYELETQKVQEEWEKGRAQIRQRLMEGIEERRRRAREEKDGEGTGGGDLFSTPILLNFFFLSLRSRYLDVFMHSVQTRLWTLNPARTSPANCVTNSGPLPLPPPTHTSTAPTPPHLSYPT